MPLMSDSDREKLSIHFENELEQPVSVSFYTQTPSPIVIPGRECPTCEQTQMLLSEVCDLSDRLELRIHDYHRDSDRARAAEVDRIPAIVIDGPGGGGLRFFGIPAGNEFPNLIEALVDASKGTTTLTEASRESLSKLEEKVHLRVFTTPT